MSTTPQKTWLGNILAKIAQFFSGAKNVAHDFAVVADHLANVVKKAEESTLGQTLETGLEMIIPASTGLVNAFKLYWPKLITTLNLAVKETGKSDEQIILDGAAALAKMKGIDPNAYAVVMTGISALVKQWLMDNTGNGGTIQQSVLTQVIAHDPALTTILGIDPISEKSTDAIPVPAPAPDDAVNITPPTQNMPPAEEHS